MGVVVELFSPPRSRIIGALRRLFSQSLVVKSVREKALSEEVGPRGGKMYICASCKHPHPGNHTQVDHIDDVIPLDKGSKNLSYDEIIKRMWCVGENGEVNWDNLQVLCKECHDTKTKASKKIRMEFRKRNKNEV